MKTIQEGKTYLKENFKDGVNCPCCGQLVRLWAYRIHSTMARVLVELHISSKEEKYHHINALWERAKEKSNIRKSQLIGGDFAKLVLWGLIESMPKDPELNKRSTGFWAITELGKEFVKNDVVVPKILFMFDGHRYDTEGEVTIIDTLKKKFDYFELMKP